METNSISERKQSRGIRKWAVSILVVVLWIATMVLGLVEIYLLRQTSIRVYAHFSTNGYTAILIANVIVFIAAISWLVFAVGSGEYHLKKAGQPGSWTLFAWSIAIEMLILILYFVV
jgi:hypothetical protein